jgi:RNA polymerase sigma factor (sigma-70 family)
MSRSDVLSDVDKSLDRAMQSGFKRIRSWRVPPNWSRRDWFEELMANGTAAAWKAVCEFDPKRGVPLAAFGYCRIMNCCLARYRSEWRHALHLFLSTSSQNDPIAITSARSAALPAVNNVTPCSREDLQSVVGALPPTQRQLIKQLFWEERTECEVAKAWGITQSTINRRKQAILRCLHKKLCYRNGPQNSTHKHYVRCNIT